MNSLVRDTELLLFITILIVRQPKRVYRGKSNTMKAQVLRWPLDVIDDHHLNRPFGRFELQAVAAGPRSGVEDFRGTHGWTLRRSCAYCAESAATVGGDDDRQPPRWNTRMDSGLQIVSINP